MVNINRFIGIPYKFNGRSFDGCDCLGLVCLFYKEHGWIDINDGIVIDENWRDTAVKRIKDWFPKHMNKINKSSDLQFGDIVITVVNGCLHFAIYLEYGKVLSTQVLLSCEQSYSTIYNRNWWDSERCFRMAFRRK